MLALIFTQEGRSANRDMRFYADLVYNGTSFRGREVEFFAPGGLDSQEGLLGDIHFAATGYTIRKFQDESIDIVSTIL